MRKTYHICIASHDEVLYRSEADMIRGFNCLAETVLFTESRLLAEGFMSTHRHIIVQTDDPVDFVQRDRYAYSRYFNARYGRSGRLGERQAFITEIEGLVRLLTALNYVNRQGLHHGLVATPFAYPHCSVNSFFQKDFGKSSPDKDKLLPSKFRHRYLTRNVSVPDEARKSTRTPFANPCRNAFYCVSLRVRLLNIVQNWGIIGARFNKETL